MIIKIKQNKVRNIIDLLLTILGWIFLLTFLYQLIMNFDVKISYRFSSLTLANTNAIVLFTCITLAASTSLLLWWGYFNKKKYGSLNRRSFPLPTKNKEIAEFFEITHHEVLEIQDCRYVERE
ncbi:MAG: poly-beta-1,6-N-acetyl-D-glucosamine biosynthesis protein PgaD [Bacillota bacterium]